MYSDQIEVFRLQPQRLEVSGEERPAGVHVERLGHADFQVGAFLHQLGALFLGGGELHFRQRIGDHRRFVTLEGRLGRDLHQVGVFLLDGVNVALDDAHLLHVFDSSLFAGGDDEALRTVNERHFGLHRRFVIRVGDSGLHVNEGAQALVLAEIAAGSLVAGRGEGDGGDLVEADEGGLACRSPTGAPLQRRSRWRRLRRSAGGR